MALERVSMLEDQLAASSQEVKSNVPGLRFDVNERLSVKGTFIWIVCLSLFSGNLFKRPN